MRNVRLGKILVVLWRASRGLNLNLRQRLGLRLDELLGDVLATERTDGLPLSLEVIGDAFLVEEMSRIARQLYHLIRFLELLHTNRTNVVRLGTSRTGVALSPKLGKDAAHCGGLRESGYDRGWAILIVMPGRTLAFVDHHESGQHRKDAVDPPPDAEV